MYKGILIKNGHIIDPFQNIDWVGEILIEDGKIIKIARLNDSAAVRQDFRAIDAAGLYVMPGLVDMHTHLREPGYEHKETIKTGTMAAIRGGVTSVCCMANTNPVNDNESVTEFILRKASAEGACHVYPIGAITKGLKGEELAEIGTMYEAGCVGFSDDGRPVLNSLIMRRALEYSKTFKAPIISHAEDIHLAEDGVMNEGAVSVKLGLKGIPNAAEDVMVARDIILAELTGGKLHVAHVSTEGSVRLIREAKERGLNITAETCPHYFSLTDRAVEGYNTNAKVNPPLRTQRDIEAIKDGLRDGTIDVIATDHAPHHRDEKMQEFDKAPFGISGLETALSLSLRLVHEGVLTLPQLVEKMSLNPAMILTLPKGSFITGADADVTIVDINKGFKVEADKFVSKGANTPFDGLQLRGMAVMTICKGKVYDIS
ncbi:MAG: dihydroorotase [Nitrospirae bacterium]|nr:dihydroorotase [Nitrospirota bacterium]